MKTSPNKIAVILYRISHKLARKKLDFFAVLIQRINLSLNGCEIHPLARIGNNLQIVHSSGIVIGKNVVIGKNLRIYSSVVIGVKMPGSGLQPKIGNNVLLSTGSKILGDINLGSNVIVGANSVVISDIPNDSTVVGIPAKVI